jgi:hypothetical protein
MPQFVDQRRFRELAAAGDTAGAGVEHLGSVARATDDGSRTVRFVLSDGSIDRMGDSIDPYGWELTAFRTNPVVLFAHLSSEPPVGRMVRTFVANGRLMGDVQFASADVYPFADQIYKLVVNGFIRACSVGFLPIEWEFSDDGDRQFGIDFKRQELLELSIPSGGQRQRPRAGRSQEPGGARRRTGRASRASADHTAIRWHCQRAPLVFGQSFTKGNLAQWTIQPGPTVSLQRRNFATPCAARLVISRPIVRGRAGIVAGQKKARHAA